MPGRRGFLSSFHYVTLVGGHVLAQATLLVMLTFLDAAQISRVGLARGLRHWRHRRHRGVLAAAHDGRIAGHRSPSQAARSGQARASGSMRELLVHQWRPLLLCFLITAGGTVAFYTYSVIGPKMIQGAVRRRRRHDRHGASTWSRLTVLMLLQPLGGWLSDLVGRKSLLVFFGIGGVLYTWFLVLCAAAADQRGCPRSRILTLGFVILTGYTSINAVVKAELFPTHVRALGVGLGYALANSPFGGTAPLLYAASTATDRVHSSSCMSRLSSLSR